MIDTKAVTDEIEFVQDQIDACCKTLATRAADLCKTLQDCREDEPNKVAAKIIGSIKAAESMNEATFQALIGLEGRMEALRYVLANEV